MFVVQVTQTVNEEIIEILILLNEDEIMAWQKKI
jgi:hypothetical protein